MNIAHIVDGTGESSPRFKARIAGVLYFLAVVMAVAGEFVIHGRRGFEAGLIAIGCYVVVTLILYGIFKPVSQRAAFLAALCNLVGLILEALRWNPGGVDLAMVFHGLYCILVGYLIVRSTFLPRILGAFIVFAGLVWVIYLAPRLAGALAPFN